MRIVRRHDRLFRRLRAKYFAGRWNLGSVKLAAATALAVLAALLRWTKRRPAWSPAPETPRGSGLPSTLTSARTTLRRADATLATATQVTARCSSGCGRT